MKSIDQRRELVWKMIAADTIGSTIRLEVWNERSPEDTRENYIELTLASDNASFTYRMNSHAAEEMIAQLKEALDYSHDI